jgi:hypothetical protein
MREEQTAIKNRTKRRQHYTYRHALPGAPTTTMKCQKIKGREKSILRQKGRQHYTYRHALPGAPTTIIGCQKKMVSPASNVSEDKSTPANVVKSHIDREIYERSVQRTRINVTTKEDGIAGS